MDKDVFTLDRVAIRMVKEPPLFSDTPINGPQEVVKVMADTLRNYDREVFAIINLRPDLKPINVNIVSMGALDQSLVHPREVIKSMVLSNAASVMMVHNHTTGSMSPSKEDIAVTDRMSQLCGLLGIKLIDHIIVGPGKDYYSFHEKGVLPLPNIKCETDINRLEIGGLKVAETSTVEDSKIKMTAEEYREKQAAQLKEITDKLEQGVQEVFQSDSYKELLNVMARMPHYSINNQILIAMQTEGQATMCQSFTGWKQMGRYVKAGEKGIKIFAPAPYTIQRETDKLDTNGKPVLDSDGEPVKETKEVTINAFKVVSTFDISQTDGKEIPTIGVDELTGDVERFSVLMDALTEACPVPITFEDIPGGAKGYYSQTEKRIAIQEGMSEVQTVKTALHEMAHQKLHDKDAIAKGDGKNRESKEVEAESVAYVVCQHYGIDTSEYSFGYVAGWSEGKEVPELKSSLDTIRKAASEMIYAIDKSKEKIVLQKTQEQSAEADKSVKLDTADKDAVLPKTQKQSVESKKRVKDDTVEKPEKKPSVRKKIQEGKEKSAKTPVKKSRAKGAEIA